MYPSIKISNFIIVPTYYLIISIAVCFSLIWLNQRSLRAGLSFKVSLDLSLICMVFGFLGGRAFHVLFEEPFYYFEHWPRVIAFWNGGFVFYGGAFLAGLVAWIYMRIKLIQSPQTYLDLLTPNISFVYLAGRMACFLAGCCYGKFCDLPWAVGGRHPTQLYAVFWELGVLLIILGLEKAVLMKNPLRSLKKPGSLFLIWILLHSAGRIVMETFRDDFRGPQYLFSISTWISIILFSLAANKLIQRQTSP